MDNPLKDTGPTGYDGFDDVYLGPGMQTWNGINPEQDGPGGGSGGGGGGGGSSNGYHYDWATGHYEDGWGNVVSWNKVYNNYVLPNANYTVVVTGNTTIDRLTSLVNIFYDVKKLLNADYSISIGVGNDPITIVGAGVGVGDGYSLLAYLYLHYQFGGKQPITLLTSELDLSFVSRSDLKYHKDGNFYSVNLFSLNPTSPTALALGNISLNKVGDNLFTINQDEFDFNYLSTGSFTRNIVTLIGGYYVFGQIYNIPVTPWSFLRNSIRIGGSFIGGSFKINFTGTVYIKP